MARNRPDGGRSESSTARLAAERLRARRKQMGISIRELASRVGVSPSLVSQIETGKVNPSVGTLVAISTELELSLDQLFLEPGAEASRPARGGADPPVLRAADRPSIELATGVRWHRLTPTSEADVDFLYAEYEVGGASTSANDLIRHSGREYGLVLSGCLGVTVGTDDHRLGPGDSIVFDAEVPHRFWAIGDEPAIAVWAVIGRAGADRDAFEG